MKKNIGIDSLTRIENLTWSMALSSYRGYMIGTLKGVILAFASPGGAALGLWAGSDRYTHASEGSRALSPVDWLSFATI